MRYREMIYTGPVDAYFDFRYGEAPYRSLDFKFETVDTERLPAEAAVINYPNDHAYTRIHGVQVPDGASAPGRPSVVYEFPRDDGDPYYPIPKPETAAIYARYKALADVHAPACASSGGSATCSTTNMDQVVGQALATFEQIKSAVAGDVERRSRPAR